jgi:hypothetical protein
MQFRLVRSKDDGSFDGDYGSFGVVVLSDLVGHDLVSVGDIVLDDNGYAFVPAEAVMPDFTHRGVVKVTAGGEPATFGQNGWFEFPGDWGMARAIDVDHERRVLVSDEFGVLHRLTPLGVPDPTLPAIQFDTTDFYVRVRPRIMRDA